MNIHATYANQLSNIVATILSTKAIGSEAGTAVKAEKEKLAHAIRDFATDTARDGVKPEEASAALRVTMLAQVDADEKPLIPGGTIKNYCSAFRGYRVMLARAESIDDVNTQKATLVVASDEVKAITAHKKAFAGLTKGWKAAQWAELVELYTPAAEVSQTDAEQVNQAVAA